MVLTTQDFGLLLSHFLTIFSLPLFCYWGWLHTAELIAAGMLECGAYHVPEVAAAEHACFWDPIEMAWLTLETLQVMAGLY